jgi:4-amino-4-deoxy-L-arabinose transferase-like glycosyltransferase
VASDGEQQQQQEQKPQQEQPPEGFTEALIGKDVLQEKWLQRWKALPLTFRVLLSTGGLALFVFLPYLGAVGLWDPWETHYGEVARMMVVRRDYVFPWWENAWFFSKPPMTMWMQALGLQLVGALDSLGELGRYTEWGMRVPFALLSATAVALMSLAVARVVNARTGLATGFVLVTMPLYYLLTRQTVTDTPFVTSMMCAMACAFIGQLDETTKHRSAWWYAFYVFLGLSVLAKGLLGVLPAAFLLLYALLAVIPWSWAAALEHLRWLWSRSYRKEVREGTKAMPVLWGQMFRMRLGTGFLVFCGVAVPWYLTLSLFNEVDDEGKGFFYRFFIHDHLNRLTAGVHTTTPGGTFIYFIEQGGYAIFPWVALLPGAFAVVSRLKLRSASKADHLALIAVLWVAFSFWLLASSATKFHHYVFPILPGLAILIALFIDRLWKDGPAEHAVSLLFGLVLFILVGKDLAETPKNFTDLFVYNYGRPYPSDLVTKPLAMFSSRSLWIGDLVTLGLLALGLYLAVEAFLPKSADKKAKEAKDALAKEAQGTQAPQAKAEETPVAPAAATVEPATAAAMAAPATAIVEAAPPEPKPEQALPTQATTAAMEAQAPAAPAVTEAQASATPAAPEATAAQAPEVQATPVATEAKAPDTQAAPGTNTAAKAARERSTARIAAIATVLSGAAILAAMGSDGKISAMGLFGLALAATGLYSLWEALRGKKEERKSGLLMAAGWLVVGGALAGTGFIRPLGTDVLLRGMMEPVNVRKALGFAFAAAGALAVVAALKQARVMLFGVFWTFALCFACWMNWNHWVKLSHHWTQRDLFWRYYRQHQPGEPIAAFEMNWRGETFYSRNRVEQFRVGDSSVRLRHFVAPAGREWVLTEHARLPSLTNAVGPDKRVTVIDRDINNKFVLVTVD